MAVNKFQNVTFAHIYYIFVLCKVFTINQGKHICLLGIGFSIIACSYIHLFFPKPEFPSFYGWVVFYSVYTLYHPYPAINWWMSGLISHFSCCELSCTKHGVTDNSSISPFKISLETSISGRIISIVSLFRLCLFPASLSPVLPQVSY